ncbi:MAG: sugar kinase [Paracoccaceae bacterium]
MSGPDILCLGEPLVEFVREPDGRWRMGYGGDTSNAAISAARQGARVGYLGALGADLFGDGVVDHWAVEGVDAAAVRRDPNAPTGLNFVEPDPAARRFTYVRKNSAASLYGPEHLDHDAVRRARVLHLSGITLAVSAPLRAAGLAAMETAQAAGTQVSLDTNLRLALWPREKARAVLRAAAERTDVLVTSIDDSEALFGLSDADAIIDMWRETGPGTVIVTMGERGCRLIVGEERRSIAAAPSTPVDSTGAGDSFSGAFHAWRLETGDAFEAARRAAIVAAGTVSGYGATAPIPHRAAVLAAL